MKHCGKKIIGILLAAFVLMPLCGCVKHTHIVIESHSVGDYFCSFFEDGTVEITSYNGADESITIPERIEDHAVIGFGMKAFDGCQTLKEAYIPKTVASLPAKLFNSCPLLERIYIPASVRSVGNNAIYECPAFTTILYGGTQQQWNSIDVGAVPWTDNYVLINAQVICEYTPN